MVNYFVRTVLLAFVMSLLPAYAAAQCGVERWTVKTGTDADATLINLSSPTSTTIANLRSIPAPGTLPDNNRVQPTETTLWTLNATLTKFVLAYDSDYHMVLTDSAGHTMIAEIPSPDCVGTNSPFAAGIAHARAQFDGMFTATTAFQTVNVPVQITGVGFFDYQEGQEGIAPNAIELHPIIDINFSPYFSVSASPQTMTIPQGGLATSTIASTLNGNFNSTVTWSASGLPAGASASFSPASLAAPGGGVVTLTLTVGATTPIGTYNVTVIGTGGGQTHSTTIALNVTGAGGTSQQLLGNTGFENGASNTAPWTVTSGVIDNSGLEAPHAGSWKAWLDGYGSAHTDTLQQAVTIPANASAAGLSFWLHIDTTETATTANDTLKLQIRNSAGTVLATLATYSNRDANAGYRQVSFDLSSYKGQTIQVYLVGVENSKLRTSFVVDDFALNVTTASGSPDFTIAAAPGSLSTVQGGSAAATITTTIANGFNSLVGLSATGLPAGATANFNPASIAAPGGGSSTMTILIGTATTAGVYPVTITGSGGGQTHATVISLTVATGGGSTQQLLGNPGFESGSNAAPWTASPDVIDSSATKPAHLGSWKAWLGGYGTTHTDTLAQTVAVPAFATSASLSFWLHIDTAETTTTRTYDTLAVQVRNSAGSVLTTLVTYSNLNAAAGYKQVTFDLNAYRGQTIQVYLVGVEDSSLQTSFVVDDFALNVTTP
jgi:hypothetical protein